MNHWYKWAMEGMEKEELFQDIRQLVEDMIKELIPPIIEEYLKDRIDSLNVKVYTELNGKINDIGNFRQDIQEYVIDSISKSIK